AESDKLIGGKLLGRDALGFYAVASHLASLPIQKLAGILNSVAFPAFSQANTQNADVSNYLLKATRIMSIVSIPMFLGISVVALELVLLLLGEKWQVVALPLQILALIMPLRMLSIIITSLFFGIGQPKINAQNYALAILVMPLLFYFCAEWDITGLSMAWLAGFPLLFIVFVWRACRAVGIWPVKYLDAIYRPLCNSTLMYAAVTFARPYVAGESGEILHLAQLIVIGVCVYAVGVLTFDRVTLRELTALLRS
ncbi:MAG: oligosaccharide flippase family protein, partial [Gammaproteobacteria bacterium]|nr:oligosaccharide flippase family protein [Gammaproteobacteria bacterium]